MRIAQSVALDPTRVINGLRVAGVMQVQLDVVIARVARDEFRQFGFNFVFSGTNSIFGSTPGQISPFNRIGTTAAVIGGGGGLATGQGTPGVVLQGGQIGADPTTGPANLFLGIFAPGSSFLSLLQALRTETLAKILAQPSLVTLSGRQAHFVSGGQQAVPTVAGLGGTAGVEFVPFGTQVDFLPIVMGDGKIYLEVEPRISSLDPASGTPIPNTGGGIVPGRLEQRVHTAVLLESGQTFAIAGLIQKTTDGTAIKTPVLGDLPFIGAAFSRKSFEEKEEELVILVTPRLVDPMDCYQTPKVLPGQETRSPDDFELFLESILEAPRGAREVFPNGHYVPAYKNGPTAGQFPCAGNGAGGACGCAPGVSGEAPAPAAQTPLPAAPVPKPGTASLPARTEGLTPAVASGGAPPFSPVATPLPVGPTSEDRPGSLPPGFTGAEGQTEPK
jgi:pilus assembly protein CpaC